MSLRSCAPVAAGALITLLLAGCGDRPAGGAPADAPADGAGGAPAAPADGVGGAPGRLAQGGSAVEVTPEDAAVFARTIDWAYRARLDTLGLGPIIAAVGRRFVGAPYVPKTLDPPGPERLIVNLRTFDCVTYVESMLALARVIRSGSRDFQDFIDELRRVRYRDGIGGAYPQRLHYFSDWIATNDRKGIIDDITAALGAASDPSRIDFMTAHADLYAQLADSANLRAIAATEADLSSRPRAWIPESRIAAAAAGITDGDIIAATSTLPGLDVAHTGLALWIDGRLHLMHAPLVGSAVEISEVPLAERILRIDTQDGIMVARPL
jgi:hypothetical protein